MKRTILAATFIAIVSPAFAGTFKNEPTGFRHIQWGAPFSSVKSQMRLAEKGKTNNYYTRLHDKMSIGGASLENIYYNFFDGKFAGVMVITKGFTNKQAILEALRTQFGDGRQKNPYIDDYVWSGDTTTIFMSCNKITYQCRVLFNSMEMQAKADTAKEKAAEKAKGDF